MTAIAGQGGSVLIAAVVVANLDNWSIDLDAGLVDITPYLSPGGWKTFLATVKGWSGKTGGRFDPADTTGQVALINGTGTMFAMSFMIDATHKLVGNAFLGKVSPKSDGSGVVTVEFDFTGTGACTYT